MGLVRHVFGGDVHAPNLSRRTYYALVIHSDSCLGLTVSSLSDS